jgi:predicted secreted protein
VFVIEQALSVRALQELVTAAGSETVSLNLSVQQTKRKVQITLNSYECYRWSSLAARCSVQKKINLVRLYLDKQKSTQPIIAYFFDISGSAFDCKSF